MSAHQYDLYKVQGGVETVAGALYRQWQSIVLPNLILGDNVFPELIQEQCRAEPLADALASALTDRDTRLRQREALAGIAELMSPPASSPSVAAAEIVLRYALTGR